MTSSSSTTTTTTTTPKRSWAPEWLDDFCDDDMDMMDNNVDMGLLLDELKALEALHPPKKTKSNSPRRMKAERRDQVREGLM